MKGGPRIQHIDEIPSEEMLRFRFKDGRTASIWEKWIEMSPRYLAFWNQWDPGAMTPQHGHHGDHINYILQGEITNIDGQVAKAGCHVMLEYGDVFGPWKAGPDGCTLYGFIAGEGSAFSGDADVWQRFLEENDAESLPVPMPKRIPHWKLAAMKQSSVVNWVE